MREDVEEELDGYFNEFNVLLFTLINKQKMVKTIHKHLNQPSGSKNMYILEKLSKYNNVPIVTEPLAGTSSEPKEPIYLYNVITYDGYFTEMEGIRDATENRKEYNELLMDIDDPSVDEEKKEILKEKEKLIRQYLGIDTVQTIKSEV